MRTHTTLSMGQKSHKETSGYDSQELKEFGNASTGLYSGLRLSENAILRRSFQNDPIAYAKHKTVKLVLALHETLLHLQNLTAVFSLQICF